MYRKFEVVAAKTNQNRLTITPDRVTVKIVAGNPDREKLIKLSKKIAAQVNYHLSLRGNFQPEFNVINLQSGKMIHKSTETRMARSDKRALMQFNMNGDLLLTNNLENH